MEDGIGNILYILLMIAVLALSMLKKARGQGEPVMPEHEVEEAPGEVFPRFDDWFDNQEAKTKKGTPKKQSIQPTPRKKLEYKGLEYKKSTVYSRAKKPGIKKERFPTRAVHHTTRKSSRKEETTGVTTFWKREPINLRNAIIYSEIIKRPGF